MKKILFIVGNSLGNQIETLPAFFYCQKTYSNSIDILNPISKSKTTNFLFKDIAKNIIHKCKNQNKYKFQVITFEAQDWAQKGIPIKNKVNFFNKNKSEVQLNLTSAKCKDKIISEKCYEMFDNVPPKSNVPDILLHDGYNKSSSFAKETWKVKSYPSFSELATRIKNLGLSVGSIGSKEEYIKGTENYTGTTLQELVEIIKGCKVLISTDTGTYHLANLLRTRNIVLFTCTNPQKNYDKCFHKYSNLIRLKNLPCSPCQKKKGFRYWITNKNNCKWECQNIPIKLIIKRMLHYYDP